MSSFDILAAETRSILDLVPGLIKKTFPVPGRFRSALPSDIAELSRLLTNKRGDRSLSYIGRPNFLSAYLHYFLPWNLFRLCLLLPHLDIKLSSGGIVTDLGCGPLTFASALWIARPDLRAIPLEFRCIDRCAPVLEAGKKFFAAVCNLTGGSLTGGGWKIHLLREDIDIRRPDIPQKRKKASLVCAVNILNEIYEHLPHSNIEGLKRMAANAARLMHNEALASASILTVEPGVPQSGRFISFLRAAFLKLERPPASPCAHAAACPMPGGKSRWCHFAFETSCAPKELHRLSSAAGVPKERLVLSYLLTGAVSSQQKKAAKTGGKTRVISDAFPLPDSRFGRYGCSAQGLVLLTGEKRSVEKLASHSLVSPVFAANGQRDKKSGALTAEVQ
jgi:ribosomal protein RSM22 (predicted rRNA methylase)